MEAYTKTCSIEDEDPVITAYLAVLESDLKKHPERRTRLSKTSLARAVRITKKVKVKDEESLPSHVVF